MTLFQRFSTNETTLVAWHNPRGSRKTRPTLRILLTLMAWWAVEILCTRQPRKRALFDG